jgi:ribonucleoside-diphosphate reductase alpha chain
MRATVQRHIDQSISSTINLPRDTPRETVERIYRSAWQAGCKGITVYREGSREGILLTNAAASSAITVAAEDHIAPRPLVLPGLTFREAMPLGTAFITVNHTEQGRHDPLLSRAGTIPLRSLCAWGKRGPTWKRMRRLSAD